MAKTVAKPHEKVWRLEMWPIDRPKDYPGNPRKIPDKAITGQKAIHEETGKTFEEMKDARYDPAADTKGSYDTMVGTLREQHEKKGGKKKIAAKEV
jgi:hypothetical protein